MIVATPSGDVAVEVKAGDAERVATEVRAAAESGQGQRIASPESARAACGIRQNAVASPFGYAESVDGCAVFGYEGYVRGYQWFNTSDVSICVDGRGYVSGVERWATVGCQSSGGSSTNMVPWGNVLSYTKVRGLSLSGITGGSYQWIT
jgi:hypothetical protein